MEIKNGLKFLRRGAAQAIAGTRYEQTIASFHKSPFSFVPLIPFFPIFRHQMPVCVPRPSSDFLVCISTQVLSSVTIVGHSLGAALALFDGVFFSLQLPENVTVTVMSYRIDPLHDTSSRHQSSKVLTLEEGSLHDALAESHAATPRQVGASFQTHYVQHMWCSHDRSVATHNAVYFLTWARVNSHGRGVR